MDAPDRDRGRGLSLGPRALAGFAGRLLLVYGVLVAPWPGLPEAYARAYCAAATALGSALPLASELSMHPLSALPPSHRDALELAPGRRAEEYDAYIAVRGRAGKPRLYPWSTRYFPYLATAALVALVVATPLPWRRRAGALALGLALVHLLLAAQLGAALVLYFGRVPQAVTTAARFAVFLPWYVAPLLAWAAAVAHPALREGIAPGRA